MNTKPTKYKLADLTRQVEIFNHGVSVGDPVTYKRDNGEPFETKTRTAAYVLSGHTAAIFLDGMAGCVLLSRVTPKPKQPEEQTA